MLSTLFEQLNSVGRDLQAFAPELLLCGTIVVLLLLRLFSSLDRLHMGYVALVLTLAALAMSWMQWAGDPTFDPRDHGPVAVSGPHNMAPETATPRVHGEQAINIFTGLLVF